jgi:hypothetical protein
VRRGQGRRPIRTQLRPIERAAFFAQYCEKKLRGVIQSGTAAFGNAATSHDHFVCASPAPHVNAAWRSSPCNSG